jgi:hypothetical protein
MIISALISSFCIGLFLFIFDVIFSYSSNWHLFTMIAGFLVSFIIISLFGIPTVIMLKKFNNLNWITLLTSGFALGFIVAFMLFLFSHPSCNNCSSMDIAPKNIWTEHIIASAIQGLIGMIASAIFYKVLLIRKKQ